MQTSLELIYKDPKSKPKKIKRKRANKLPMLSHNTSSNQLAGQKPKAFSESFKNSIKGVSTSQIYNKYQKLKSISRCEDEFDRLCVLSDKNHAMRNNSVSIQQKLIEINSRSKLPLIKDANYRSDINLSFSSHIDSVLQKYQEDLRQKLKLLEGFI